jgi:hypothetical protein
VEAEEGCVSRYDELMSMIAVETDECIVWPHSSNRSGYGTAWHDGKQVRTHRAALCVVCPPPTEAHEAAHGPCHNRLCVNPQHLSWKTRKENFADTHRDGTYLCGEAHQVTKFSDDIINGVRALYAIGNMTQAEVGLRFGVSRTHVSNIVNYHQRVAA